jgi:beta-glucosidase
VINANAVYPASPSAADYYAFRIQDGIWVRMYMDPLFGRHYPADIVAEAVKRGSLPPEGMTFVEEGDLDAISTPLDFIGLNYYLRGVSRADIPEGENLPPTVIQHPKDDIHWTEMGWEIYPKGLYEVLARLYYDYKVPKLYVTENGASFSDGPGPDGLVRDERRVKYLRDHFTFAHSAIQDGIPLKGYFVWSLFDNFEWARGYAQRFGIIHVDYETQKRTLKDSALWYKDVIENNGFPLLD